MADAERSLLYRTAIETGLRSNELRSLTRGRLHLTGGRPYVACDAAETKNGRAAQQFVTPALAADLAAHVARKVPGAALFKMPHETNLARMLRADLAEARKAWLAESKADPQLYAEREASDFLTERNEAGEVLDFHALRHTCGGWLTLAGESPKVIQSVMRHAQISLTLDTSGHLMPGARADAVGRLADLLYGPSEGARATGTTDAQPDGVQRIRQQPGRETAHRGATA